MRVIVENFEHLPAHDAAGSQEASITTANRHQQPGYNQGDDVGTGAEGGGIDATLVMPGAGSSGGAETLADAKPTVSSRDQHQPRRAKVRGIPAKFIHAISAGLSTSLDPKVR